jgi:hypothetical protein
MKAITAMLGGVLWLGAGACTSERTPDAKQAAPTVHAGESARAGEPALTEPATTDAGEVEAAAEPAEAEAAARVEPAAAPAETEAAEPSKPASPAPSGVFAAVVRRKRWTVDMTEFEGIPVAGLEKTLVRALETKGEDAARRELAEGDPLLPPGFAVGDPWTLVTRKGVEHRTAESFAAQVMGGSGKLHVYVRLGAVTGAHKGPALALRGALPLTTALTVPAPLPASAVDAGLRKRIDSSHASSRKRPPSCASRCRRSRSAPRTSRRTPAASPASAPTWCSCRRPTRRTPGLRSPPCC